jgi:transposase
VNQLSRDQVDEVYRGVGKAAYDPIVLLKMVLYQILLGHHSPATWSAETGRNATMQWLGRGYRPARRTWYDFRDRAGQFIESLHEQLVRRGMDGGHLDPTTGALDGSSMAACASRHRMVNEETLRKRRALLEQALECGQDEHDAWPRWMPTTSTGRVNLLARMDSAKDVLQQRLEQNAAQPSGNRKERDKIVVSLSDPDAPLGRDKRKTFRPLYTVQKMVDPVSHLTISYTCEASVTDAGTLAPMIDKTQRIVGGRLRKVLADGGYCTILDIADAQQRNIDLLAPVSTNGTTRASKSRSGQPQIPRSEFRFDAEKNCYICPEGNTLAYKDREKSARHGGRFLYRSRYQIDISICQNCQQVDRCLGGKAGRMIKRTAGEELLEAQRAKMETDRAKAEYRLRGQTVELVFADDKGNRGHDRLHGRGLDRARAETGLLTLARNILRLDNLIRAALNPGKKAA